MTALHSFAHLSQVYFPKAIASDHLAGQVARLVKLVEELSSKLSLGSGVVPVPTVSIPTIDLPARTDADGATAIRIASAQAGSDEIDETAEEDSAETIALASARRLLSIRRKRDTAFEGKLFCDPAWDILIELYVARFDCANLSVGDACVISGVPLTSALRCCQSLEKRGIVRRERDPHDRRRIFLRLTDAASAVLTKTLAVR